MQNYGGERRIWRITDCALESVQNWKFCKMSLFLARSRFEYCASRASPKKLARHWSLGPSLEMSPKFGKLASTSPCKWSIFKLIHYFFPFPCFIYLHLIQFYVRLNKITFLYVWIIVNIISMPLWFCFDVVYHSDGIKHKNEKSGELIFYQRYF